jgi:hypothetical protein
MSDSREAAHDYFNSPLQLQNPCCDPQRGFLCLLLNTDEHGWKKVNTDHGIGAYLCSSVPSVF